MEFTFNPNDREPERPDEPGEPVFEGESNAGDGVLASNDGEADTDDSELQPGEGFLSFRQLFDGTQPEIPLAEQKEAGALFRGLVDGVLRDYAQTGFEDTREYYSSDYANEGEQLSFIVTHLSLGTQEPQSCVCRIELFEDGSEAVAESETVIYELDLDGILRRKDENPSEDEAALRLMIGDEQQARRDLIDEGEATPQVIEDYKRIREELLRDYQDAERLKEILGLYRQPVGLREAEALVSLIRGLLDS